MAAQYDYDGAIALLKEQPDYDRNDRYKNLVATYEETKASCISFPIDQITHVFYHSLIYDDSRAFDGDQYEGGYNQVMTTVEEFNSITEQMYNKGYVMVSLHDMVLSPPEGTLKRKRSCCLRGRFRLYSARMTSAITTIWTETVSHRNWWSQKTGRSRIPTSKMTDRFQSAIMIWFRSLTRLWNSIRILLITGTRESSPLMAT